MAKAPYIIRKDDYSVHQRELDLHHRRIVEIVNELREAIGHATSDKDVMALLIEVREYSQKHFDAEEELMRHAYYPGFEEQRRAHLGYKKLWPDYRTSMGRTLQSSRKTSCSFSRNGGCIISCPLI